MKKIWIPIKGYEGLYEVSSDGRVKSLTRAVPRSNGNYQVRERILEPCNNKGGYPQVTLQGKDKRRTLRLSTLVWDAFGDAPRNGRALQVDHIDGNKKNNHISNLQLLTSRANTAKRFQETGRKLSTGVYHEASKFRSRITIDHKLEHLGYFHTELEAQTAYINRLREADNDR